MDQERFDNGRSDADVPRNGLILEVKDVTQTFIFNNVREIVIGRSAPDMDDVPDVDLLNYGGEAQGVSRKHASLVCQDGMFYVVDHESRNGTFVNGERLVPEKAYPVKDGDEVRLGNLLTWVYLVV